jgi:hypothetical protein
LKTLAACDADGGSPGLDRVRQNAQNLVYLPGMAVWNMPHQQLADRPMKILMISIVLVMIAGVLSLSLVGGRGSKQIAKGQPLLASSSRLMGPR